MRGATVNTLQPQQILRLPHKMHITYETSFTMRGATVNTFQPHQILRLPHKMTTQHLTEIG